MGVELWLMRDEALLLGPAPKIVQQLGDGAHEIQTTLLMAESVSLVIEHLDLGGIQLRPGFGAGDVFDSNEVQLAEAEHERQSNAVVQCDGITGGRDVDHLSADHCDDGDLPPGFDVPGVLVAYDYGNYVRLHCQGADGLVGPDQPWLLS